MDKDTVPTFGGATPGEFEPVHSRERILAWFTRAELTAAVDEPARDYGNLWSLYDLAENCVECPRCKAPMADDFYSCGDGTCCYSHNDNECVFGINQLTDAEKAVLLANRSTYRFESVGFRLWRQIVSQPKEWQLSTAHATPGEAANEVSAPSSSSSPKETP